MTPEQLFSILNLVAVVAWILLVVLPRQPWIASVVSGVAVPALLAAAYVVLIGWHWRGSAGGFSTLTDVALLFSNPWLLLAGWTHYLAFDLLVGAWEARDARSRGINHWLVVPCLILTFLFGPAGWLLYMAMRAARLRQGFGAAHGASV
jgi:hypothetical protein